MYINVLSHIKENNPKSNMTGKIKTLFLSITLILSYMPSIKRIYVLIAAIVTVMFQIIAFIKYRRIQDFTILFGNREPTCPPIPVSYTKSD